MWPDNETVEDLIGFRVHAHLIHTVVTDARLLPTIAALMLEWFFSCFERRCATMGASNPVHEKG